MTTAMLVFVTATLSGSIGLLAGWYLRPLANKPDVAQITHLMDQIVNLEEMEAQRRRNVALMAAAKRREMPRTKAYGPARVSKAAFRRTSRWR